MRYQNIETGVVVGVRDDKDMSPRVWKKLGRSTAVSTADVTPDAAGDLFDPTAHNVDDVVAYLAGTDDAAEHARVLAAETAGKNRTTVTGWTAAPAE